MKIVLVAGARPNFMKVAPILAELRSYPEEFVPILVHTGQHYDREMSSIFFSDLELPPPDFHLKARSDDPVAQTAHILTGFDSVLRAEKPDLVAVVGDTTSTLACALAASKGDVPVAHVEAGLRSGDRRMPEELNRIATDALADVLFTYSEDSDANLKAENVPASCIFRVGNVMIDTMVRMRPRAAISSVGEDLGLVPGGYAVATLHRPSNVDDVQTLEGVSQAFARIQERIPIVFPVHPRTRKSIESSGLAPAFAKMERVCMSGPMGYLDLLNLLENARMVLTDSGGLQEETTVLKVPCLTLRSNTERPITVEMGTNVLVGSEPDRIVGEAFRVLEGRSKKGRIPDLWDGRSAERLVAVLRGGVDRR